VVGWGGHDAGGGGGGGEDGLEEGEPFAGVARLLVCCDCVLLWGSVEGWGVSGWRPVW
jgi:hypothetical protein